MQTFRTRQAPSPTGYLHFGTARQILFTKLFALARKGIYYLRLEDTDQKRLNPDAATKLIQNISTLGLQPDEGVNLTHKGDFNQFYQVWQDGPHSPYIQSQRLDLYHWHAQKLIDQGLAYWSYLTPQDKEELQQIKQATKQPINYYAICSQKFSSDKLTASVTQALADPQKPVLMYKLQRQAKIQCQDILLGDTTFDLSLEEDFGILKSDGFPTYHLAHLVDDYLMQTTLAIRAQEWLASMPKHITMYQDYWGSTIQYLHLPVILSTTGNKKMSKRDGNVNMQDYLDKGYLPEAILNYLAFLGWNPGTEQELFLDPSDF